MVTIDQSVHPLPGLGLGLYRSGTTPSPEVGPAHRHSAGILTPKTSEIFHTAEQQLNEQMT
jgi:hypothetical protein